MTKIHAQILGPNILLRQGEWERLLGLARQSDEVKVEMATDDVSTVSLMKLVEEGGAFDFWHDDGEDIYSVDDGEPI